MSSFPMALFQLTLSYHGGDNHNDYNALWWDELPVDGITTSFIRLEILSLYSADIQIRVFEMEIFAGHGRVIGIGLPDVIHMHFYGIEIQLY